MEKWGNWTLDIKHALLQADFPHRDVSVHAPPEWASSRSSRTSKLRVASYGLHDAPVAFYATLHKCPLDKKRSIEAAG